MEVTQTDFGFNYYDSKPIPEEEIEVSIMGFNFEPIKKIDGQIAPDATMSLDIEELDGDLQQTMISSSTHIKADPDKMIDESRGLRGLDAHIQATMYFSNMGFEVTDITHDRTIHGDLRIKKKNKRDRVEIKELNEFVSSGNGKVEKEGLKSKKNTLPQRSVIYSK